MSLKTEEAIEAVELLLADLRKAQVTDLIVDQHAGSIVHQIVGHNPVLVDNGQRRVAISVTYWLNEEIK